ncbi:MAG: hypothetical protein ABR598_08745, partial [Candidatus Dormibacteria bacterium]
KGKTDPAVLATLKTASLAALSELGRACGYDGLASGAPVYVNGDPVNLSDPTGHDPQCDGCSVQQQEVFMGYTASGSRALSSSMFRSPAPARQSGCSWANLGGCAHQAWNWSVNQAAEAGTGLGIGAVQLGEGLWGTAALAGDCANGRSACGDKVGGMATAIGHDPGRFAGSLIDYEDFSHGRIARGVGHLLPSIALALATGSAGNALAKGGEAMGVAAEAETGALDRVVIGKLDDIRSPQQLISNERTLLPQLPDLPPGPGRWAQNERVLLNEMGSGNAIRDASVDPFAGELMDNTGYLARERGVLRREGWNYDPESNLWGPGR